MVKFIDKFYFLCVLLVGYFCLDVDGFVCVFWIVGWIIFLGIIRNGNKWIVFMLLIILFLVSYLWWYGGFYDKIVFMIIIIVN